MARYSYLRHTAISGNLPICESIVYDGLENFAGSQYDPNHIQHAVGKESLFIYDFNFAPLNRKGRRSHRQKVIEREKDRTEGRYPPKSIRWATKTIFERLSNRRAGARFSLYTDQHFQYRRVLQRDLRDPTIDCAMIPSTATRNFQNHLFAVNHTDLLIRQDSAAFRRETIAFSKTHAAMIDRYALFMVNKNYMRPQFIKKHVNRPLAHVQTPAMAAGVARKRLSCREFFGIPLSPKRVRLNPEWQLFHDGIAPYPRHARYIRDNLAC